LLEKSDTKLLGYKGDYIAIEHYLQNIKWDTIIWNNPHALHAWSAFLDLLWTAVDLYVPRFNTIVRAHKKNDPREIRKLITRKRRSSLVHL